jgi:hypothetical protein
MGHRYPSAVCGDRRPHRDRACGAVVAAFDALDVERLGSVPIEPLAKAPTVEVAQWTKSAPCDRLVQAGARIVRYVRVELIGTADEAGMNMPTLARVRIRLMSKKRPEGGGLW